jgi:hypothetical protein
MTKADRTKRKVKDARRQEQEQQPEKCRDRAEPLGHGRSDATGWCHAVGDRTDTPAASVRRAQGKALRDTVPRTSHAGWRAPKDRRDPIDLLSSRWKAVWANWSP